MIDVLRSIEIPANINTSSTITRYELSRIRMTSSYLKKEFIKNGFNSINNFEPINYSNISDFIKGNNLESKLMTIRKNESFSTVDKIVRLFFSKEFNVGGKKPFNFSEWSCQLKKKIDDSIKKERKVSIIFPGFPFKIRNRLKTSSARFDSAELFALIRLKNLINEVEGVYKHGCEIIILL